MAVDAGQPETTTADETALTIEKRLLILSPLLSAWANGLV